MRLSRTVLTLVLISALSGCAARGAAAGSSSAESAASPAGASGMVQLLNYDEILRLMSARVTTAMRSEYRGGFVVLELELDAGGAVTNSRYKSAGGGLPVNPIAREVAPRMRFTRPAAAGQRVLVRMAYDRNGRPDVFLEQ
jgi:hypothetical protein